MDSPNYFRFIAALLIVLGLLYGCLWLLQKLQPRLTKFRSSSKEPARLKIVESLFVDPKRRLLLVQRDDRQHLILCTGNQDLLIESDIAVVSHREHPHDIQTD